ncbi:MAG: LuxR C-terminal-related transcriptional regulator, partial [Polyangiales bacterium]
VLDQFDQPAYLCTGVGEVQYANRSAREHAPSPPSWLLQRVANGDGDDGAGPRAGVSGAQLVRLDQGLTLVVMPARTASPDDAPPDNGESPLHGLPPRLARVAELVAAGLTDQEIADHMGLTHKTVRTYVSRIYRRLGVSNRVMLTRLLVRA